MFLGIFILLAVLFVLAIVIPVNIYSIGKMYYVLSEWYHSTNKYDRETVFWYSVVIMVIYSLFLMTPVGYFLVVFLLS